MDINVAGSVGGASQQFSVALGGGIEITNAESVDELHGFESYFGGSADQVVALTANGTAATSYQGVSFGFSLGPPVLPAEGHAGFTAGVNVFSRLLCDIRSSDDCRK
jgi:hypothetical protein